MNKRKRLVAAAAAIIFSAVYGMSLAMCTAYDGPELKGIVPMNEYSITDIQSKNESDILLPDEDRIAIAKLVMAEANAESEYGQRLVIDTVLNRVDSDNFPDTVHDVIWQKDQFAAKASLKWDAPSDILKLVDEETKNRTNSEVVFFNAVGFTKYGTALFKEGGHYFSKEKE